MKNQKPSLLIMILALVFVLFFFNTGTTETADPTDGTQITETQVMEEPAQTIAETE